MSYVQTAQNDKSGICSCVPIFFFFNGQDWYRGGFKVTKNDRFLILLSV